MSPKTINWVADYAMGRIATLMAGQPSKPASSKHAGRRDWPGTDPDRHWRHYGMDRWMETIPRVMPLLKLPWSMIGCVYRKLSPSRKGCGTVSEHHLLTKETFDGHL
ncbi:MAG: hypothetical protein RLZZ596_267 [Pseudomonadota bacterium]|jgi:hypothetical protein